MVEENTVPEPKQKPRLTLNSVNAVRAMGDEAVESSYSLKNNVGTVEFDKFYQLNFTTLIRAELILKKQTEKNGLLKISVEYDKDEVVYWNNPDNNYNWELKGIETKHYSTELDWGFNSNWQTTYTPWIDSTWKNFKITGIKWTQDAMNDNSQSIVDDIVFYYTPVVTLEITKPAEIIAGDTDIQMTATGNSGTVKWSLVDENGETTSYSFATITEDGKLSTTGSGTIYVMAQDDTTSVVSSAITITPFQITNKPAEVTVLEDSKFTPVTNATTDVTISVGEGEPAIVNGAEVTFTGNGTVTVTAKHGAATDSITFTVNSKKFAINVEPDYKYIHKGMTITLTSNPTGAEWAVKNSDDAKKVIIDGNQIIANVENANVVLTGTRGSESSDYTLQICPLSVNLHGSDVTPNLYTMNVNSIVPFENVVGNLNIHNDGGGLIVYDEDTNTIRTGEKTGEAEISVSDAGQTLTFRLKVEVTQAEPNIPSTATKVQDITISTTNNWISSVVSGLPKTDGQGHTYRYFIKEEATGAFIPVAYSTSSEGAALQETPITLDLTNSATQSTSTTLPEAGSTGTKFYTAIGGIMLILSAAGYTTIKRRRWFEE